MADARPIFEGTVEQRLTELARRLGDDPNPAGPAPRQTALLVEVDGQTALEVAGAE